MLLEPPEPIPLPLFFFSFAPPPTFSLFPLLTRAKNGGNGFLCRVATVGQARAQIIDKLDEACTNGDDRMMLVQHNSGDRVMS